MVDENQANTVRRGVSLDQIIAKLHNPQYNKTWIVLDLSKIKSMKEIPEIQNVDFWDYYKSQRWRYGSSMTFVLAAFSPIIYARFRYYQREARKKANS